MSMDQTGMEPETSGWAAGWITFAGIALIMIGVFHAIAGLAEVFDSDSFVLTRSTSSSSTRAPGVGST